MKNTNAVAALANEAGKLSSNSGAPALTASSSRADLIRWLGWNDAHGTYSDADCAAEGMDPLTTAEAWDLVASAVEV